MHIKTPVELGLCLNKLADDCRWVAVALIGDGRRSVHQLDSSRWAGVNLMMPA